MGTADYGTLSNFDRSTKHRLAYTFEGRSNVGSTTFVDGVQVMNNTALQSSAGELTELIIGNYNKTSNFATGMRVSKIALFDAKLSAMDVADYFFPSEQTTLSYTEDVSVSQILTDMDGALKATVTIADGKTISVDTAVPSDKALDLSSLNGTITLNVAEGLTFTASKLACTNVVKTGKGAIVFTRDGGYRGCTIADGSASTTTGSGYGAYSAGSDMDGLSTITVGPTATLDVSGSRNSCYIIVSNGGTITNTGDDIPTGNRQTTKLVLNADTVVSGNLWGLRATGGKPSRLETNGHKLIVRMNANKGFILYDCTVTGGGILSLESGSLAPGSNTSIDLSDVEGVGTGTVLVEWAEGVATPTLAGISVVGADGYAVSVDTSARQIKLVGNVAAIGGTEFPTLAAAVAAATAGYTNEAWTGSVTIKDFGELDSRGGIPNSGHVRASFPGKAEVESWQNANSRITFKGVKAWVNSGVTYDINLVLEDQLGAADEVIYAWHNDSGGSSSTTAFTKLSGTGAFYDNAYCAHVMKFGDCSDFSGAFHVTGKRICIGAEATVPANGGVSVALGQSIVAAGQTWRALAGVSLASGAEILYAGGPLTLAADTALTATGTIGVGLKGEVALGNEMPVLAWNEKPTDVTWEKGETIPTKYFLRATTPALCLRKLLPLVITVR